MQRSLLSTAWLALFLSACNGGVGGDTDSDASGDPTGILPPTAGDTSSSSSSGESDSTTTGEPDPTTSVSSSSTTEDPFKCDEFIPPAVEPVIPQVVLVLDKSGSMLVEWDHDSDPMTDAVTRWSSLRAVVDSIVTGLDTAVDFGALLFPSLKATSSPTMAACVVDAAPLVPVGPQNGVAILDAIPQGESTTLAGGTPSTEGIKAAVAELGGLTGEEPKFIIFITDGAANCDPENDDLFNDYDDRLALAVADAAAAGFKTHVVGIDIKDALTPIDPDGNPDGINPYEKLNELAEIAGTARPGAEKFYNATNQDELQAALMAITETVLSCEINLGEPVPDNFYIKRVEVGADGVPGQLVYTGNDTQVAACDSEAGWQYTSDGREAIVLCGDACQHYKETGVVEIEYGCFVG